MSPKLSAFRSLAKRCLLCRFPVSKVREIMKRVMESHLLEDDATPKAYSPDYTRPLADEIRTELRGMLPLSLRAQAVACSHR